jgi:hypothetical protein
MSRHCDHLSHVHPHTINLNRLAAESNYPDEAVRRIAAAHNDVFMG